MVNVNLTGDTHAAVLTILNRTVPTHLVVTTTPTLMQMGRPHPAVMTT